MAGLNLGRPIIRLSRRRRRRRRKTSVQQCYSQGGAKRLGQKVLFCFLGRPRLSTLGGTDRSASCPPTQNAASSVVEQKTTEKQSPSCAVRPHQNSRARLQGLGGPWLSPARPRPTGPPIIETHNQWSSLERVRPIWSPRDGVRPFSFLFLFSPLRRAPAGGVYKQSVT